MEGMGVWEAGLLWCGALINFYKQRASGVKEATRMDCRHCGKKYGRQVGCRVRLVHTVSHTTLQISPSPLGYGHRILTTRRPGVAQSCLGA